MKNFWPVVLAPIARSLVAALIGIMAAVGVDPQMEVGEFQEQATGLFLTILITVALVAEKALKPMWRRLLREQASGDTPPPPKPADTIK